MKQIIKISLLGILALIFAQQMNAQDTLDLNKIEAGVDKYLRYFSGDKPGAVVSVIKKGDIVFHKAYGLSNIDNQENMQKDELFNLGELSKSFTGIAIFKLAEKGKLSLDQTLTDIFPEFPEYGNTITIKHILDHKSGLENYDPEQVKSNDEVYTFLAKQNETTFQPGSKFVYSNSDYPLLATIIEKASGKSYEEFLKKYVFKKLKMENSYFISEIENKLVAASHFKEDNKYIVKEQASKIFGGQGIFMNASDYAKYDRALYTDKILDCESLQKIFRVGELSNQENVSDYTSGWALMARKGIRYFWQGGSQGGYSNLVLHLPDTQTTVLLLANRNDGYDFLKMAIYIAKQFNKDLKL